MPLSGMRRLTATRTPDPDIRPASAAIDPGGTGRRERPPRALPARRSRSSTFNQMNSRPLPTFAGHWSERMSAQPWRSTWATNTRPSSSKRHGTVKPSRSTWQKTRLDLVGGRHLPGRAEAPRHRKNAREPDQETFDRLKAVDGLRRLSLPGCDRLRAPTADHSQEVALRCRLRIDQPPE